MDTDDRYRRGPRLGTLLERWYPLIGGATAVGCTFYFGSNLVAALVEKKWSLTNLFSAGFNWSAIQTAFVFGIYAFVVGHSGHFLNQLRPTMPFQTFLGYTWRAILYGFLLTIISIPALIIDPQVTAPEGPVFTMIALWLGLFTAAVLSFFRVAYIFRLIARIPDQLARASG